MSLVGTDLRSLKVIRSRDSDLNYACGPVILQARFATRPGKPSLYASTGWNLHRGQPSSPAQLP
eukprot:COSAG03_NODE_25176_length_267_cov_0.654762_1_plen_63_part_10